MNWAEQQQNTVIDRHVVTDALFNHQIQAGIGPFIFSYHGWGFLGHGLAGAVKQVYRQ